jgi:CheY-like chemotaxis protein
MAEYRARQHLGDLMDEHYQDCNGLQRFLVVEDEPLILDLIVDMIRALGYAVAATADTLSSARRELCKNNFDAVLLDLSIDGQDGPEIADQLLEMRVPFAFVTGYDGPFEERHASVLVLHKPFTAAQLAAVLDKLAGHPIEVRPKTEFDGGAAVYI